MTESPTPRPATARPLRVGARIGKYRLDSRLGSGGFADVFAASDTLLGIKVALKIPRDQLVSAGLIDEYRREARLTMQLDHPGILPIRDASLIEGQFVIVSPLAKGDLSERIKKRMSFTTAFDFMEQLLDAVAFAHNSGVIHCDIKPENIMLFDENRVRLGDFGIAKAAQRTISGSGTATNAGQRPGACRQVPFRFVQ